MAAELSANWTGYSYTKLLFDFSVSRNPTTSRQLVERQEI